MQHEGLPLLCIIKVDIAQEIGRITYAAMPWLPVAGCILIWLWQRVHHMVWAGAAAKASPGLQQAGACLEHAQRPRPVGTKHTTGRSMILAHCMCSVRVEGVLGVYTTHAKHGEQLLWLAGNLWMQLDNVPGIILAVTAAALDAGGMAACTAKGGVDWHFLVFAHGSCCKQSWSHP